MQKKSGSQLRSDKTNTRQTVISQWTLMAYFMYLVRKKRLRCSYDDLVAGALDPNEDLCELAAEYITEAEWENQLAYDAKYVDRKQWSELEERYRLHDAFAAVSDADPEGTPGPLVHLAEKLLDIRDGERVGDICCGTGRFLLKAAKNSEVPKAEYYGYELDRERYAVAHMLAVVSESKAHLHRCDIFSEEVGGEIGKETGKRAANKTGEKIDGPMFPTGGFDKIFCDHPLKTKLTSKTKYKVPASTSADWHFVMRCLELLKENGRLVTIMPEACLSGIPDFQARAALLRRGAVEGVIALGNGVYPGAMPNISIVIFSHGNKEVRMTDARDIYTRGRRTDSLTEADADEIFKRYREDGDKGQETGDKCRKVSYKDIEDHQYILSPAHYLNPADERLGKLVAMGDVIRRIRRGARYDATDLDEMISGEPTGIRFINLVNIQDGIIDEELPYIAPGAVPYRQFTVEPGDMIITKSGFPCKVAVDDLETDDEIVINGNLYAITLDPDRADPYYVKAFLESERGTKLMGDMIGGSAIPNFSITMLKSMQIPLPPIGTQRVIAEVYRERQEEVKKTRKKLEKRLRKMKSTFTDICEKTD